MLKEFRDFIAKGNMLDLAVGIVIGAAFTAIVNSLVKDLISPILGLLTGADLAQNGFEIKPGVVLHWGSFLTAVINFVIVGFVLFLIVKAANHLKRPAEPAAPAEPPNSEKLLAEIRDLLRAKA